MYWFNHVCVCFMAVYLYNFDEKERFDNHDHGRLLIENRVLSYFRSGGYFLNFSSVFQIVEKNREKIAKNFYQYRESNTIYDTYLVCMSSHTYPLLFIFNGWKIDHEILFVNGSQ